MKKILLTILVASSMTSIYAEGSHKGGHGEEDKPHGHSEGGTGGNHGVGPHWASPKEAAAKPNPIKSDAASIDRGKKSYFQYCASCHGAKAMGDGPAAATLNPRPTNLKAMSGGHPDGDFAWKIANGRGAMPAWKGLLKESQIWELVNYIQSLNPNGKMMDMSKMDHSNMNKDDMKKMMSTMGHSDADNNEKKHTH